MVMRLLNSVGCCCPSSDERQLLSPLLQSRMSLRGLVAIGWCLYGDGEDGGVDAGTVTIIAFCTDRMPVCRRSRSFVLDSFLLPFQLQLQIHSASLSSECLSTESLVAVVTLRPLFMPATCRRGTSGRLRVYSGNAYDNPMNIYDASAATSWLSRHRSRKIKQPAAMLCSPRRTSVHGSENYVKNMTTRLQCFVVGCRSHDLDSNCNVLQCCFALVSYGCL